MSTVLVVAKAPVPGRVKTRLAADLAADLGGDHRSAALLAAAALLDTIEACTVAVGASRCRLAVAGSLDDAVDAEALRTALAGWVVVPQQGDGLGERLARAHAETPGPLVQVGMDTPQVTAELLHTTLAGLADHDAVLAPATDGGWWALAVSAGRLAAPLAGVPLSTPTAHDDTRAALVAAGLSVGTAPVLTDVDRLADAAQVAAAAPGTRFAARFAELAAGAPG